MPVCAISYVKSAIKDRSAVMRICAFSLSGVGCRWPPFKRQPASWSRARTPSRKTIRLPLFRWAGGFMASIGGFPAPRLIVHPMHPSRSYFGLAGRLCRRGRAGVSSDGEDFGTKSKIPAIYVS
jgi:hypothetical protein